MEALLVGITAPPGRDSRALAGTARVCFWACVCVHPCVSVCRDNPEPLRATDEDSGRPRGLFMMKLARQDTVNIFLPSPTGFSTLTVSAQRTAVCR